MSLTALKLIPGLSGLVGIASLACGLMDVANGQSVGGVGDFAKAAVFGDAIHDEYHADGGSEPGSIFGKVGQVVNGTLALGLSWAVRNKELMKSIPGAWGKAIKVAGAVTTATQITGAYKEFTEGDGQGIGDIIDGAGDVATASIGVKASIDSVGGMGKGLVYLRRGVRAVTKFCIKA